MSLPGCSIPIDALLISELAHALESDGQRREIGITHGAHVREHALPDLQSLLIVLEPASDAGVYRAAGAAGEHALGDAPVRAEQSIAQLGSCNRLPGAFH